MYMYRKNVYTIVGPGGHIQIVIQIFYNPQFVYSVRRN